MAARKEAAPEEVTAGTDTAEVNEPTKFATGETERPAPDYYIATAELFAHGVRAHMPGDRVPSVNVEKHGWQDGVKADSGS